MATRQKIPKGNQKIRICKNGPYLISGKIPLITLEISTDAKGYPYDYYAGDAYALQEEYALCRCGRSATKPFCDATHLKVKFNGTERASRKPYLNLAELVEGPDLNLTDVRLLCSNAGFCTRAGGIRNLIIQSDNPEPKSIAIEEAANCNSGRLVVWDKETGHPVEPEFERSIALVEEPQKACSGPIWVRGGVLLESADGTTYETRNRVALCRCGESSNQPFCDGSHVP